MAVISARKKPKQRRSRATVEAILEATARILVADGYDKASTNRIAEVAGVSVGSLYQYFPSKESLVMALCERHCEEMLALFGNLSAELLDAPLPVAIRTWDGKMDEVHRVDPALHQALVSLALHIGLENLTDFDRRGRQLVKFYLDRRKDEIIPQDTELAAFVLAATTESITHRAVLVYPPGEIPWDALEAELNAIVLRYLLGHEGELAV